VTDPGAELLEAVCSLGDPAPCEAPSGPARRVALLRRRFGLSLPPPFAAPAVDAPVRPATAVDGPAIAAVKWRAFGTSYRGVFPDAFLDGREVVPPPGYWVGRALAPPSRRHRLFAWGPPGAVLGYLDCGPVREGEAGAPAAVGEVYELYVDPCAQGLGGGGLLLDAATSWLAEAGFTRAELSVVSTNEAAQAFYRSRGWAPTGEEEAVDLGIVAFVERRFGRSLAVGGTGTGGFWSRVDGR